MVDERKEFEKWVNNSKFKDTLPLDIDATDGSYIDYTTWQTKIISSSLPYPTQLIL
jgi:hypothetical protein